MGIKHLVWLALVLFPCVIFANLSGGSFHYSMTIYCEGNTLYEGHSYYVEISASSGGDFPSSFSMIRFITYGPSFRGDLVFESTVYKGVPWSGMATLENVPSGQYTGTIIKAGSDPTSHTFTSWKVISDDDDDWIEPALPTYTLGVAVPTGGGSIVNVNEGEAVTYEVWEYEDGTDVDLSVIPNLGWSFHSWLIDGSATSTSDTLRVTMDDNHVVEARFTDNLDPIDPDNPDDDIKRSEWWGTYEKTYDDVKWKEWTLNDSKIADFITSGGETGVYYDDDLIGFLIDNESVHIMMPLIDERYWIYGNGQAIGYIDENDYICLGNRTFSHTAGHINVDGSATFLGQAAEVSFGSKIYGVIRFYDEYGEVILNIRDRFWEGYWIPDDPMYDPEDPGTYPDEPEWKDIPEEPDQPGIFDEIFEDIKRFIVGFLREYFMPDQDLLEFHANELKRKASDKFPFSLFWIPEKLQGEYKDVDIPLLDLSMFGVDDFKVDWFNNEYMDQAAEWMKNFSRYLLWFMFILWLRDNITPVLVID